MFYKARSTTSGLGDTIHISGPLGEQFTLKILLIIIICRITWHPVVLTHSFTRKNLQTDSVKLILQQLESLDIKFINDFVRESTTHVLAKKRNTPKTLQALIDGKYIVQQDSFLQAIISVADPRPNGKSQLEVNFDDFWPNALNHLPPQGNEPTQVSVDAYSPDLERQTVFQGYTFLFIDKSQHSNLFSPISNGGGKALLKEVEPGVTVIHEFVGYIKSIAHEEGLGEFEDGSEGAGVVLVEYLNEGPTNEWYTHFITQVSQLLNHRPITQSEFLDAILRKNASVLRRPLEPAPSGVPPSSAGKACFPKIKPKNYTDIEQRVQFLTGRRYNRSLQSPRPIAPLLPTPLLNRLQTKLENLGGVLPVDTRASMKQWIYQMNLKRSQFKRIMTLSTRLPKSRVCSYHKGTRVLSNHNQLPRNLALN